MTSNLKKLGDYIEQVDIRNKGRLLGAKDLYGVSVYREFIPTHANLVGVEFHNYKIVKPGQFTYIPDTSRRGDKIAIALNQFGNDIIVSNVYTVFKVSKPKELSAEYLMMLFRSPEFDRYARYNSWGSVREIFPWEELCNTEFNIPSIDEQERIIRQYGIIEKRIATLNNTKKKLNAVAAALINNYLDENSNYISIYDIVDCIKYGKGLATENLKDSGYLVYGGNGIIGRYYKYLYEHPQILVSCRGAASGKVVISKEKSFITSNSLIFELKNYETFEFYKYYFLNNELYDYTTGSAQPQITIDNLSDLKVPSIDLSNNKLLIRSLKSISCYDNNIDKEIDVLLRTKRLAYEEGI